MKYAKREARKERILNYIRSYIEEHRYSPSMREIGTAVGLKSSSTIYWYLSLMKEEGTITYQEKTNRTIRLLYI